MLVVIMQIIQSVYTLCRNYKTLMQCELSTQFVKMNGLMLNVHSKR